MVLLNLSDTINDLLLNLSEIQSADDYGKDAVDAALHPYEDCDIRHDPKQSDANVDVAAEITYKIDYATYMCITAPSYCSEDILPAC